VVKKVVRGVAGNCLQSVNSSELYEKIVQLKLGPSVAFLSEYRDSDRLTLNNSETVQTMTTSLLDKVRIAAEAWAMGYFGVGQAVGYVFEDEEDEPGRFIVSLAIAGFTEWQAAEVWIENGQIGSINWLGEGLSPDGVEWPW
jgi:hypothetical protein